MERATNFVEEVYELEDDDELINIYLSSRNNNYKQNILVYCSGFIHKKIKAKESCVYCRAELDNILVTTCPFLELKNKGGLTRPAVEFTNIVQVANSQLEHQMKICNIYMMPSIMDRIFLKTLSVIDIRFPNTFSNFDNHVESSSLATSHRHQMIKKVVFCYISMRLKHLCKEKNENTDVKVRRKLCKLVLFKNQ